MKISGASKASGCHQETIRYYEKVGLMPQPQRSESGYRAFSDADVDRLRFISRGRELGFSLEEIRSLLRLSDEPNMSCMEVDQLARSHLVDIRGRISELQCMAEELDRVIGGCAKEQRGNCAILGALRRSSPATLGETVRPANVDLIDVTNLSSSLKSEAVSSGHKMEK